MTVPVQFVAPGVKHHPLLQLLVVELLIRDIVAPRFAASLLAIETAPIKEFAWLLSWLRSMTERKLGRAIDATIDTIIIVISSSKRVKPLFRCIPISPVKFDNRQYNL